MFPNNVHAHSVDSGDWDWALYKAYGVPDNCDFDIHQWWDSMKDHLLTMYPYAVKTWCITHTSCDVEHSVSMWKNVHSENRYTMQYVLQQSVYLIWIQWYRGCPITTSSPKEMVCITLRCTHKCLGRLVTGL